MLGGLLKINVANTLNVYSAGEKGHDMIWVENWCWWTILHWSKKIVNDKFSDIIHMLFSFLDSSHLLLTS